MDMRQGGWARAPTLAPWTRPSPGPAPPPPQGRPPWLPAPAPADSGGDTSRPSVAPSAGRAHPFSYHLGPALLFAPVQRTDKANFLEARLAESRQMNFA